MTTDTRDECEHHVPIEEDCDACIAIYEDEAEEHEW